MHLLWAPHVAQIVWSTTNTLQGNPNWRRHHGAIESGDSGVLVTCDMGREGKCIAESVDLFSQVSIILKYLRAGRCLWIFN